MREADIDLGCDHFLTFTRWAPDRELNPQYADIADNDKVGAIIQHMTPDGVNECSASVFFKCEAQARVFPDHASWTVESFGPLTLSPSIRCSCGDHGYIRNGAWVRA